MALDFLKSDPEAAKAFKAKPDVDPLPTKKAQMLTKLDSVIAAVKKNPGTSITRWYKVKKDRDGASVGLNVGTASVAGNTSGRTGNEEIIKSDAVAFFSTAKAAIEKGEMDDLIRKALEGGKTSGNPTAPRDPSSKTESRPMTGWKTYRRNIGRYGLARADELGKELFGEKLPDVKREFEEKKDTELTKGWEPGWWKKHFNSKPAS
uniref:Uncharacterized protein n=1 Tax=viral metagenome TaxID=1070528 RepID=A0A6M3XWR8_9ZZZZ